MDCIIYYPLRKKVIQSKGFLIKQIKNFDAINFGSRSVFVSKYKVGNSGLKIKDNVMHEVANCFIVFQSTGNVLILTWED
jgi:hypothetical protein